MLQVAQDHFLTHGYAATSMSNIAAAIGGSKATLWNYFPSKEALFSAAIERVAKAYRARLSEILDPAGPIEDTLSRACVSLMDKVTSDEAVALQRLIIAEGRRFPELTRIFFDLAPNNTRILLARFLEGAMDRGDLRKTDPSDAARVLMGLLMSGTQQQLLMGRIDRPTPEEMANEAAFVVDIFLRAYAPERSGGGGGQST